MVMMVQLLMEEKTRSTLWLSSKYSTIGESLLFWSNHQASLLASPNGKDMLLCRCYVLEFLVEWNKDLGNGKSSALNACEIYAPGNLDSHSSL